MTIIVQDKRLDEFVDFLKRVNAKILSKKRFVSNNVFFYEIKFEEQKRRLPGPKAKIDKKIILEMRAGGSSLKTIAENMHCSKSYVQKVIRENNIQ